MRRQYGGDRRDASGGSDGGQGGAEGESGEKHDHAQGGQSGGVGGRGPTERVGEPTSDERGLRRFADKVKCGRAQEKQREMEESGEELPG